MSSLQMHSPTSSRGCGVDCPRSSLERKLLIWTLALTLAPTLVCTIWTSGVAQRALSESHAQAALELGRSVAASVVDHVTPELVRSPGGQLQALVLDARLAFVQVIDAQGQVCYDQSMDDQAWSAYELWRSEMGPGGWSEMGRPIFPTHEGDLVVWQLPIWNPPKALNETTSAVSEARRLEGMVILALRDRHLNRALSQLVGWQLVAACVVCVLMLPAVIWVVRRWVKPLRELVQAASHLGAGMSPPPVTIQTHDEVGQLACEFNHMARNLYAARLRLQRANNVLERQVEQRTAQLQSAKRRLESEIKDKDEFLRAVSHDLGAPLRNIGGMATMLLTKYRQELAEEVLSKLERINANVKVQSELIGDLLELSLLRTRPGKCDKVDLNELLAQVRDNLAFDLERKTIDLRVPATLPTIVAERNRMRQVFQNLLDNAIKYMGDSEQRCITVACQTQQSALHFTVKDTGPGIVPEDQDKVFQVFMRGRHSAVHQVPGRGVGLAGVKTIVECYGGRVWVESEFGHGSTFHFTLDRSTVDPDYHPSQTQAALAGDATHDDLQALAIAS